MRQILKKSSQLSRKIQVQKYADLYLRKIHISLLLPYFFSVLNYRASEFAKERLVLETSKMNYSCFLRKTFELVDWYRKSQRTSFQLCISDSGNFHIAWPTKLHPPLSLEGAKYDLSPNVISFSNSLLRRFFELLLIENTFQNNVLNLSP